MMKVLIVDDEQPVRESVELSIKWAKHDITEIYMAGDGIEALDIVRREAPELIICDMSMPRMDGTGFLEVLREEGWDSKVIVLSGYQEFRYARATLLADGVDYLLKPFKIDDLDKAIARAVQSILGSKQNKSEEWRRSHQVNEAQVLLNEQKMVTYLQNETVNHEGVRQLLTDEGFPLEDFYILLFLPRNVGEVVDRYFMGDESLLMFSVRNILRDVLNPLAHYYFFRMESFLCVLTVGNISAVEMDYYRRKLEESWMSTIRVETFSGFSRQKFGYRDILSGLKEAKTEILKSNVLNGQRIEDDQRQMPSLMDKELLVLEALKKRDKEYLGELIRSFVMELRARGYLSLKELQHYTIEANLLIMRVSRQLELEQHIEPLSLWISDLEEWEKALTHTFWMMIESEGENLASLRSIHAIRHYIESHLGEEISLTVLADRFYFSPQYISKKFKENYDMTIMNYLTQLRMDKAKSLLSHSDISIIEISQLVGYEDDNYFGKVFRKHVGESPSHYRKKQQER
ncbi:response regulator [Paenibacillus lutimineralis]|uniref:Response regulator n=1 Tax=Paenibacillus lutimineralis TaxID=2707005 RepID=A0A3Q9I872_9BACL|nr:response regulator [Paenibacillus lutimineralis]AZS13350.1 response regulator [Paenibacillus lutimineralis]